MHKLQEIMCLLSQISIAEMWTFIWKKGIVFCGKTEYITHAFYQVNSNHST